MTILNRRDTMSFFGAALALPFLGRTMAGAAGTPVLTAVGAPFPIDAGQESVARRATTLLPFDRDAGGFLATYVEYRPYNRYWRHPRIRYFSNDGTPLSDPISLLVPECVTYHPAPVAYPDGTATILLQTIGRTTRINRVMAQRLGVRGNRHGEAVAVFQHGRDDKVLNNTDWGCPRRLRV